MNRTVSQCPQQHTHAHTPSLPVSINPRTTNKRNPDAAALSGPRMADTMVSDTEPSALPNAEQSAVCLGRTSAGGLIVGRELSRPSKRSRTSCKNKSQRVSQLPHRRPPLPPNPRRRGALWLATLTRGASVDWRKRRHLLCRRRVAPTGRL